MTIIKLDGSGTSSGAKLGKSSSAAATSASSPTAASNPTLSSTCCLWTVGLLIWAMVLYMMATPSHVVDRHRAVVDQKLASIAQSLSEKKISLSQQMDDIKASIARQKETMMNKTGLSLPEVDLKLSLPGVVGKEHHEEEVGKLTEQHEEEVTKLQTERDELRSHHDKEVAELQASIASSQAELEKLKASMANMKVEKSRFCEECAFDYGGLRTTCGARKNYLISKYGDEEDIAIEAVVQWDPNCLKKER
mmetsp:Transcript_17085/g.37244  ORF Transcript_17085/g.37244 Transcript_17085/m.37244 type:complete len:250 (+) Transcript_17085:148-897(+)